MISNHLIKLWHIDVLTDSQHDKAVAKVEKLYNSTRKDLK